MKRMKKGLIIAGILFLVIVACIFVTQLTGLSKYITPDLLILFGALFLSLAMLVGLIFLITFDIRGFWQQKNSMKSRLKEDMKTLHEWKGNHDDLENK